MVVVVVWRSGGGVVVVWGGGGVAGRWCGGVVAGWAGLTVVSSHLSSNTALITDPISAGRALTTYLIIPSAAVASPSHSTLNTAHCILHTIYTAHCALISISISDNQQCSSNSVECAVQFTA